MSAFPDFSAYGYEVTRELGHNRAGGRVTYLAIEINTQRTVVVKQYQFARGQSRWTEFGTYEREIEVLRGLNHANIPRYLDSFQTLSGFCMVQDYKQATSLASRQRWPAEQVKQIAIAVLDILKYLQSQIPPIIHRDLKPDNILVDDQLNVYLVDFGFARLGGGQVAVSSVVKGTFGFMPPEQMFNRELTQASDLYSLGMTLMCLLTHTRASEIGSLIDASGRVNLKRRLSHLNPDFVHWLHMMVDPNHQKRYPDATTALSALLPLSVRRPQWNRWLAFLKKHNRPALATIGLLGLISTSGSVWLYARYRSRPLEHQVVFTNSLDRNFQPITRLQGITGNQKVYIHLSLHHLQNGQHDSRCRLLDGTGNVLEESSSRLIVTNANLETWCLYQFNPDKYPAGTLRFQFYLGNRKTLDAPFTYYPDVYESGQN